MNRTYSLFFNNILAPLTPMAPKNQASSTQDVPIQPQLDPNPPEKESVLLKIIQFVLVIAAVIAVAIYINPTTINPQHFELATPPTVRVVNTLDFVDQTYRQRRTVRGPESIAIDPTSGVLYFGTTDGKLLQAPLDRPFSSSPETFAITGMFVMSCCYCLFVIVGVTCISMDVYFFLFSGRIVSSHLIAIVLIPIGDPQKALPLPCGTHTTEPICGRPLGLKLETSSSGSILYIADAYYGIIAFRPDMHRLEQLVSPSTPFFNHKTGQKQVFETLFFNDVVPDLAHQRIYFSVTSTKYPLNQIFALIMENGNDGFVGYYDLQSRKAFILSANLALPNGLIQHPTRPNTILVSELGRARILSINTDPRSAQFGKHTIFADNLPLLPDNLATIGDEIWVAGTNIRVSDVTPDSSPATLYGLLPFSLMDALATRPTLRKIIAKAVPEQYSYLFTRTHRGGIVRLNAKTGAVIELLTTSAYGQYSAQVGTAYSLASVASWDSPDLPPGQIYVYIGSYSPDAHSIARLTWDTTTKTYVQSDYQKQRDQLRQEYRAAAANKKRLQASLQQNQPETTEHDEL